jgi:hypothetical protein
MQELAEYKMNPETMEVATAYVELNDIDLVARTLSMTREEVTYYLNKAEVKRFLNTIFLEQGYLNRGKIQLAMSNIIEKKLEELEESEMGSNKDIAELLMMAHKMRMDEINTISKSDAPSIGKQTNVQINAGFGENYTDLLSKLTTGG